LVELGRAITRVAEVTPGGILIFFPSYRVMERCHELWQGTGISGEIEKKAGKKVFMEPKDPAKYQATMERYYKAIFGVDQRKGAKAGASTKVSGNGAILMGVCRGRISEGLDFSDNAARCVIVIGIPYPQMTDPKVILKKDYLDRRFRAKQQDYQPLSGKDWYGQQATRAVN
jgi:Rad3-related DNA helicase